MTDPESTDNTETRTWSRMDIPERELPDGARDPFDFFNNENGSSDR